MKQTSIGGERYRIVKRLGGSVFLTMQASTCQLRVIKKVSGTKKRLTDMERNYWMHLSHPGIAKVLDIFEEGETVYYVMEYFPGKTLQEIFDEKGRISEKEVREWMIQMCRILNYLHTRSPAVVHGDLKPANIYCLTGGRLMLLDFGAAFLEDGQKTFYIGTAAFASPEQKKGEGGLDARSDLYSLGAAMYYLLTGRYWEGSFGKKKRHRKGGLYPILEKCMKEVPKERYRSCAELEKRLLSQKNRGRNSCMAILATALLCTAVQKGRGAADEVKTAKIRDEPAQAEQTSRETGQEETWQIIQTTNQDINQNTNQNINQNTNQEKASQKSEETGQQADQENQDQIYETLLQKFMEDGCISPGEELELQAAFRTYGESHFLYQAGCLSWYYSQDGTKAGAVNWFRLLERTEKEKFSEEEKRWIHVYRVMGEAMERPAGELLEKEEAKELWEALCFAMEREVPGGVWSSREEQQKTGKQLFKEVVSQVYLYADSFQKGGIKKEDYEAFTNQAELRSLEGENEENTVREQIELLKETIQNLF